MDNHLARHFLPYPEDPPLRTSRGGYTVTMRETDGAEHVLAMLATADTTDNGRFRLHMGWGSFRNLDIAAARKSDYIVLLDINENQFRVWEAVTRALRTASTTHEFIDRVVALLPADPPLRQFMNDTRAWLSADLVRPGSWLSREHPERFAHIRSLFNSGRVLPYCLDIRGAGHRNRFQRIHDELLKSSRAAAFEADTLYVSNLPWMMSQETGFFGEAHARYCSNPSGDANTVTGKNLATIVPLFRHIVTAIRLAPASTATDLQWLTERFSPEELIGSESWLSLYDNSRQGC